MAYNLESLVQISQQILHNDHHQLWLPENKSQIETLLEKSSSLKDLFESSSMVAIGRLEAFESQLTDAIYKAEDVLESILTNQILSSHGVNSGSQLTELTPPPDLDKVVEQFDAVKEEIMKIMEVSIEKSNTSLPAHFSSQQSDPNPNQKSTTVVGFSEDMIHLKDKLTAGQSSLEIIPIVGMGGIGKTTLARNVYNDPSVISHFDTRAWITISQEYTVRGILLGLLGCLVEKVTDEMLQELNNRLAVRVHKLLSGQRYLIVLDDMWSVNTWDDVTMFFPNEDNASRIMVTTRETGVADYVCSNDLHHKMHLLDDTESWNLLREEVFSGGICPPDLESVGQQIAKNCGGLPLAIHVIGGTLSQTERTVVSWGQVADNVGSAVADGDGQFAKILSLSYNHLPSHLKPCFLYVGAFPEDHEIRASKLVKLWIAEGFLKRISGNNLEETARVYLKALVDRNLIFVREKAANGIVKSCTIHDLLRDLCMKKARQENFLYVKNKRAPNLPSGTCSRRVSAHSSHLIEDIYSPNEPDTFVRSFLYTGSGAPPDIMSPVFSKMRLLRVLDILGIEFDEFPEEILHLINLRYLALSIYETLPSSISRLWNLQTLIVRSTLLLGSNNNLIEIPPEIWNMPQLRHIKFKSAHAVFDTEHKQFFFYQEKLQTLSTIMISKLSHSVFETVPNLKKVSIICAYPFSRTIDLRSLQKLETLKCSPDWSLLSSSNTFLSLLVLPASLKNLTLTRCPIPSGYMNELGKLPNLEVLKLLDCNFNLSDEHEFRSPTWETSEGGFMQLKFLMLEKLNLVNWVVDEDHFPRLERLVIRFCYALREIPPGVGEISTLQMIEVHSSSVCVGDSARRIEEEQIGFGNYELQVRVTVKSSENQVWL